MRRVLPVVLVAVLAIASAGSCSRIQIRDKGETRRQEQKTYLEGLVGKLTIDEALTKWGPPTSSIEGDNVIAYGWRSNQYAGSTGFASGNASSFGGYSTGSSWTFNSAEYHGYDLGLTFDKATRRLKTWKYNDW